VLGAAVGAACAGLRPCVFAGTSTFTYYGWSTLVNEAPHVRYVSGGAVTAPVVVHMQAGARRAGGVQHEHTPQAMLHNQPGLVVYAPATPQAMYDCVCAALTGDDPTVIIDHVLLGEVNGPLVEAEQPAVSAIEVLRDGDDGLIVSSSLLTQRAVQAAERLAADGAKLSVANVNRLAPSPVDELIALAREQPFVLFVDESRAPGSTSTHLMARAAETLGGTVALRLLASGDAPFPFSPALLDELVPTVDAIDHAARQSVDASRRSP